MGIVSLSTPRFSGIVEYCGYDIYKRTIVIGNQSSEIAKLPTDPVGLHTLTLTNVVTGSRIAIRDQANTTTLYDQIAAASTVVIALQVYAGGSPLNNWSIRIRKASAAPKYLPYETLMTATPGSSSIYVSQLPDPIAS